MARATLATVALVAGGAALEGCASSAPTQSPVEVAALWPFAPEGPSKIEAGTSSEYVPRVENKAYVFYGGVRARETPMQLTSNGGEDGNTTFQVKKGQALLVDRPIVVDGWVGFRLEGTSKTTPANASLKKVAAQYFWIDTGNLRIQEGFSGENYFDSFRHKGAHKQPSLPASLHEGGRIVSDDPTIGEVAEGHMLKAEAISTATTQLSLEDGVVQSDIAEAVGARKQRAIKNATPYYVEP